MRRVLSLCKRAARRASFQIAVAIITIVAGGGAVWHFFGPKTLSALGPTKQIAIGVPVSDPNAAANAAALATPTEQFAPAAGTHQLLAYDRPAETSPAAAVAYDPQAAGVPTSPYLPSSTDPLGSVANQTESHPPEARVSGAGARGSSYNLSGAEYGQPTESQPPVAAPRGDSAAMTAPGESGPNGAYAQGAIVSNSQALDAPPTDPLQSAPVANLATASTEAPSANYGSVPPNPLPSAASGPYANAENGLRPLGGSPADNVDVRAEPAAALSSPQAGALQGREQGAARATPTPGQRQLEGPQQPAITLEKSAPAEIQVGKPAVFELYVRNAGQVPAHNVVVSDHIPAGTQLLDARPKPEQSADGSLVWSLGTMQPGDEAQVTLQVMPQAEGEIGSTAHVTFAAAATSRSICTRPQLVIEHTAPPKVLIGESLTVAITVSNPGTGPATGVIIDEDVPDGLAHVAGAQLEYEVGTLRPGESKRLELSLKAEKAAIIQNTIVARGDGNLAAQHTVQLEVIAPQLQVEVEGPKRRFLERQATYTLQVANPGTAPARDVELAALLPRGMKFVTADSQGQYDPAQHAVFWSLAELPPSKAGAVKLTTLPVEAGEQRLRVEGRAGLGLTAAGEQLVQVEQAAELLHTVKDLDEVIEVGSETTYEIRVTNSGTKAATNVRIAALMPAGMAAIGGEGPTRAAGDATQVVFEPLARLNPQEEVVYKVQVQGKQAGDHIIRVQLASDEWPTPVTREESTRVYQDR